MDNKPLAPLEAVKARQALSDSQPDVLEYRVKLAGSYCNMGNLLSDHGQPKESIEWYDRALATCQQVLQKEPRFRTALDFQNKMYMGRAEANESLGRNAEALADWEQVLGRTDDYMRVWEHLRHARVLARLGRHAEAASEAGPLASRADTANGNVFGFAGVYSIAATAALRDDKLSAADRQRAADEYARQALQLLGVLQKKGYFRNPAQARRLSEDKDLAPLRSRAEFDALWHEVQKQAAAASKAP